MPHVTRLAKFYSKIWKKVRDKIHVDLNSHLKWFPKLVEVQQRYQKDSPGYITSVCCFGSDISVPIYQDWCCIVWGLVEGTLVFKDDKFPTSLKRDVTMPISLNLSNEWSERIISALTEQIIDVNLEESNFKTWLYVRRFGCPCCVRWYPLCIRWYPMVSDDIRCIGYMRIEDPRTSEQNLLLRSQCAHKTVPSSSLKYQVVVALFRTGWIFHSSLS